MLQLGPTPAEIQYVQQAESQRQSAANQLAAAWAGSVGGASTAVTSFGANPMPFLGTGIDAVPAPKRQAQQKQQVKEVEEDDDFDWGGAGMGALQYGAKGAAIGTAIVPGLGTAIGAGIGVLAGGLAGGFLDG